MEAQFKSNVPLAERQQLAAAMKEKYPTKVPVFFSRVRHSSLPEIDRCKCMVPCIAHMSDVLTGLRKKLSISKDLALFVFVGSEELVSGDTYVLELYEGRKEKDDFLYLQYGEQQTMG